VPPRSRAHKSQRGTAKELIGIVPDFSVAERNAYVAGKSTTMRLILGLDRPQSGTATIDGRRYRDLPNPLRTVGALLEVKSVHTGRSARRIGELAASGSVVLHELTPLASLEEAFMELTSGSVEFGAHEAGERTSTPTCPSRQAR
jgi:energy-coupling factor transporter ATP-binding protein EcfA2